MKGLKPLTLKEIKKRHARNPQDKELHKTIETNKVKKEVFNKLIKQSTKEKPFDKKT